MLVMSASEDAQVEKWRSEYGRCRLSEKQMRTKPMAEEVLATLHPVLGLYLGLRLKASGTLGALALEGEEVAIIEKTMGVQRPQLMASLLPLAASFSSGVDEVDSVGAVAETITGGLYLGAPVQWKGGGVKFGVHALQSAVLNAWQHGETQLSRVMTESVPCACCRQFLRETWSWGKVKLIVSDRGKVEMRDGLYTEALPSSVGLNLTGVKGRLLGEPRRGVDITSLGDDNLAIGAASAAACSYAPYTKNYAGVVIRTKQGGRFAGRYVECVETVAGIMAVESAIVEMIMCGGKISDIAEFVLVETRGTATQFSPTQKLATAMGGIPFRFSLVA